MSFVTCCKVQSLLSCSQRQLGKVLSVKMLCIMCSFIILFFAFSMCIDTAETELHRNVDFFLLNGYN